MVDLLDNGSHFSVLVVNAKRFLSR